MKYYFCRLFKKSNVTLSESVMARPYVEYDFSEDEDSVKSEEQQVSQTLGSIVDLFDVEHSTRNICHNCGDKDVLYFCQCAACNHLDVAARPNWCSIDCIHASIDVGNHFNVDAVFGKTLKFRKPFKVVDKEKKPTSTGAKKPGLLTKAKRVVSAVKKKGKLVARTAGRRMSTEVKERIKALDEVIKDLVILPPIYRRIERFSRIASGSSIYDVKISLNREDFIFKIQPFNDTTEGLGFSITLHQLGKTDREATLKNKFAGEIKRFIRGTKDLSNIHQYPSGGIIALRIPNFRDKRFIIHYAYNLGLPDVPSLPPSGEYDGGDDESTLPAPPTSTSEASDFLEFDFYTV